MDHIIPVTPPPVPYHDDDVKNSNNCRNNCSNFVAMYPAEYSICGDASSDVNAASSRNEISILRDLIRQFSYYDSMKGPSSTSRVVAVEAPNSDTFDALLLACDALNDTTP